MSENIRERISEKCNDTTPRDRSNLKNALLCLLGWAICFIGSTQLIKRGLLPAGPVMWLVAALPIISGIIVIVAYNRYLRETDELQRLIKLQALALGFGATFFAISGYRVLERLGLPTADISDITIFMSVIFAISSIYGWRRYL